MNSTRLRDNERSNSVEGTTQSKARVPDLVRLGPAKNVDLRPGCGRRRLFANRAHDDVVTFLYVSGAAWTPPRASSSLSLIRACGGPTCSTIQSCSAVPELADDRFARRPIMLRPASHP